MDARQHFKRWLFSLGLVLAVAVPFAAVAVILKAKFLYGAAVGMFVGGTMGATANQLRLWMNDRRNPAETPEQTWARLKCDIESYQRYRTAMGGSNKELDAAVWAWIDRRIDKYITGRGHGS